MSRYIETLAAVDDSLAALRAALEQAGILDQTVIVFTSDNGFHFGEHDRDDKRVFFEESIRVPLIVRHPGLVATPGGESARMVLSLDLAPTLLAIAGAPVPGNMQGRSLVPLLGGEDPDWRGDWMYEYFRELAWPQLSTMIALRTERFKYVEFPSGPDMWCYFSGEPLLFDLESDPYETRNLARDPAYARTLTRLETRLRQTQAELGYRDMPLPEDAVSARITLLESRYPSFAATLRRYFPQGYQGLQSRVCSSVRW